MRKIYTEIIVYTDYKGNKPYENWVRSLRDPVIQNIIGHNINKLKLGNLGNCKNIGKIFELKIHYGPGYRIYLGRDGNTLVILLGGGTKKRQKKDIERAKVLWKEYKRRKQVEG